MIWSVSLVLLLLHLLLLGCCCFALTGCEYFTVIPGYDDSDIALTFTRKVTSPMQGSSNLLKTVCSTLHPNATLPMIFFSDSRVSEFLCSSDGTILGETWIGLFQLPNETLPAQGWFWIDGTPEGTGIQNTANWLPGEPNDYNGVQEDCAAITCSWSAGRIFDAPCNRYNAVMCEIRLSYCQTNCPSGTCTDSSGACQKAMKGQYNNQALSTSCVSCTTGKFSDTTGSSSCSSCDVGKYQDLTGASFCIDCPNGKFSDQNASTQCFQCPSGRRSSSQGMSTCDGCDTGYYFNSSNSCAVCPDGFVSTGLFTTSCNVCAAGRKVNSQTSCFDCETGRFQPDSGQTFCFSSGDGFFNSEGTTSSLAKCQRCPAGKFTNSNSSTSCVDCPSGTWSVSIAATSIATCQECPSIINVVCLPGSIVPYVGPGLYRTIDAPADIMSCYPGDACNAGEFSNSSCSLAYEGFRCASCSEGFFRTGGKCTKCMNKYARVALLIFSVLLFLVVLAKFSSHQDRIPNSVRLALFWVQCLSLFPALSSSWPPLLLSILNFTNVFNLDIGYLGLGCDFISSYYQILVVKILFPVLLACLILVERTILLVSGRIAGVSILQVFSTVIFATNFFAVQLLSSMLQIFNCVRTGGYWVVAQEPSQECFSSSWTKFIIFDIFFIFIYVVLLPGIVVGLHRANSTTSKDNIERILVGPLTRAYRKEMRWFEFAKLGFKLCFVLVRDTLSISTSAKVLFISLNLLIFMWMQYTFNPYAENSSKNISIVWNVLSQAILISNGIFSTGGVSASEKNSFSIVLVVLIVVTVAFSIYQVLLRTKSSAKNTRVLTSEVVVGEMGGR
eukprot:TRINITY_DN3691_c0_g1_i2.p1 TRINITY_DN3691_c0_g1~~TRINITY_DN3691_c0_g1_i2.p1  ORF type:complete len:840 (-),score=134.59 TRINITY_DN3691_c0_g1_i2:908-3427(-)